jgi:adenine-specific DNA-methyltransferase
MDEVFARKNFIGTATWQKTTSVHNNATQFSSATDFVLGYARDSESFSMGRVPRSERNLTDYSNQDDDPRGLWSTSPLHVSLTSGQRGRQYAKTGKSSGLFPIVNPHGEEILPPRGRCWGYSADRISELDAEGRIWWGRDGRNQPRLKRFISELDDGVVPTTLWLSEDVGHNQEAKAETAAVLQGVDELFATPKPERLIRRIFQIATDDGDLVLDSFLGSGTTAAVAHKMGRRYVGIEMGDHAKTHCIPRLEKVIAGEQGGVSEAVGWHGGGGFRFCALGDTAFDADGRINPDVQFNTLASFIWHFETAMPAADTFDTPLLGVHQGKAYYLLYNGILGDKRPNGGNVLTRAVLQMLSELHPHDGPKIIYGETTRLGDSSLAAEGVTFQQIPYDIKVR